MSIESNESAGSSERGVLVREVELAEEILLIIGFSSTGKGLMGPILSTFARVENFVIDTIWEYVCILDYLGKISPDAADSLLKLRSDLHLNYQVLSRETNFRPVDCSSPLNNPHLFRTISRLFHKDGDYAVDKIRKERPIQLLMSHAILPFITAIFRAWGSRIKIIRTVRHPLYLIHPHYQYIERNGNYRYGRDPREMTFCIKHEGHILPWFALGWEEKYLSVNNMDRVIFSIEKFSEMARSTYAALSDEKKARILEVPFERFVLDPYPYIDRLETFTGTHRTRLTKRHLKAQKCPRKLVCEGVIGQRVYAKKHQNSEIDEFNERKAFVERHASTEALSVLARLCREYKLNHEIPNCIPDFAKDTDIGR